ncbi:MAG: hypothetical protein R8G66_17360 [Cytophagales bacterium]|nr:hypothetical protein [Cytophagales bacterium]
MLQTLRFLVFVGGLVIIALGLVIMLLENEPKYDVEYLVNIELFLTFGVGLLLIFYMVRKRGIGG